MQPKIKALRPSHANPIGQRLKAEMKKRGVTSADLAKRADVKTSFLYDVMSGKSANPSTVKLARVAQALGIGLAYLAGDATPTATHAGDYVVIPHILVDTPEGGGTLITTHRESESCSFKKNWIRDHLLANVEDLRLLTIRGDSMEPIICHNDVILVDSAKTNPSPPGIFVLFDGFGLVAKRLEFAGEPASLKVRIISDNPKYSTYECAADDTFIIGRVVWFAREI